MNDEDIIAFNKIEEKVIDSLSIPIPQLENTISQDFGKTLFEIEKIKLQQENKQLKEKVNQLETNRDEAIEFIQKTQFDCGDFNCCGFGIWKDGKNELLSLLERGKE